MTWFEIAPAEEFPVDTAQEFVVSGRMVAVCRTAESFYALDGVCPHQGGPLGKGTIHDCVLTCPWHGWQFDVRDGQSLLSPHVQHPTIPVKVEDGKVWVQVEDAD